jgi:hypothetical protein
MRRQRRILGDVRRLRAAAGTLLDIIGYTAVTVTVVALTPLVLLGGELVNRHYLGTCHRVMPSGPHRAAEFRDRVHVTRVLARGSGPGWASVTWTGEDLRVGLVPAVFLTNPAWIALTAPARWLLAHLRPLAGRGRRGGGPPPAGVREPRRPRPDRPAGALELPEQR